LWCARSEAESLQRFFARPGGAVGFHGSGVASVCSGVRARGSSPLGYFINRGLSGGASDAERDGFAFDSDVLEVVFLEEAFE
jgi:hypothetical protein